MNPELETFLQDAFSSLKPSIQGVARVLVEPDYETDAPLQNADQLTAELTKLLSAQKVDLIALGSHTGFEVDDLGKYPNLQRLVRRVTLYGEPAEDPWVEVAPPGNWI